MNEKIVNIRGKSLAWAVALTVFLFQEAIVTIVPAVKYMDEIFAAAFLVYFVLGLLKGKTSGIDGLMAAIIMLMIILGFAGNMYSGVEKRLYSQLLDAFNMFKYVFVLWGACRYFEKYPTKKVLLRYLGYTIRIALLISSVCMLLNWITDIGMHTDVKYGIRSYHFVFNRVGNLYSVCVVWLMILTAEKFYRPSKTTNLFIGLTLIHMCATLRSRAIAFAIIYLVIYYLIVINKDKKQWWIASAISAVSMFLVGRGQFAFYFAEDSDAARNVLLKYGLRTAKHFFPFGAGFGTYGTAVARDNYSQLYVRYGFFRFWGLSRTRPWFLTDTFWPAIIGELGYLGVALTAILIVLVFIKLVKTADNNHSKACVIFLMCTLLISSTVSSSFFSCAQMMLFASLICKLNFSEKDTLIKE